MPSMPEWIWNVETTDEYRLIHKVYRIIRNSYDEPKNIRMRWTRQTTKTDARTSKLVVVQGKLVVYSGSVPFAMPDESDPQKGLAEVIRRDLSYNLDRLKKEKIEPRVLWEASRDQVCGEYKYGLDTQLQRFCVALGFDAYNN